MARVTGVATGTVPIARVPAYRDPVKDNQLRPPGVLDGTDDPDFPDAPTLKGAGLVAEFPSIGGIIAPDGTDPAIIAGLEAAFTGVASSGAFETFMTDLSQPVRIMSVLIAAIVACGGRHGLCIPLPELRPLCSSLEGTPVVLADAFVELLPPRG